MKLNITSTNILRAVACAVLLFIGMGAFVPQANAKKKKASEDIVIVTLDSEPMFPGGDSAMFKWIDDNLRFPPSLQERHKRGVVVVNFIVRPDGKLDNLSLSKKFSDEANAEALRLVSTMPDWIPGTYDGHAVSVPMSIPISFNAKITERKKKDETFATWLDGKIKNRKRPSTPINETAADKAEKKPYVPAAAAQAEPADGPVYFVDGVRFYGDPKSISLGDIESYSEVKPNDEFPAGAIYITLKKK